MNDLELTERLNHLVGIGEDIIKSCEEAREITEGAEVQFALSDLASKHAGVVGELKREVLRLGEEPRETGTLRGMAERILADVKATLSEEELATRLEETLAQHERWLAAASDLSAEALSPEQRSFLDLQCEALREPAAELERLVRSLG